MSRQFIAEYLAELNRLVRVSGASRETVVREAFKDLLKRYARQKDLVFLAEYPLVTSRKKNIAVDGAIVHSLRVPLGYWEAKDAEDDLDEEIEKKFRAGYPQDNIIFEDTRIAVLIQNKNEVMRCAVDDEARLMELMELFFGYERPEIGDFRKAVAQFRDDLPAITSALNDLIEKAGATLPDYQKAEAKFLAHAKGTINPAITTADIREMLMQHILTEEIFAHVFNDSDFHRKNTVASELYALENTFFTGGLKRDTLRALDSYYAAIKANAAQITSHHEKQKFLKVIYENFYKVYNPKAADRLGVVYTPNEIVKFMIDGADWLCQQHFGKALIDPGVEILDPATGTGTFVCELLEKFRGAHPSKLHHKYREEIHANEVAILPYYVANLNIEATYYAIAQQYAEYPNLCFVDTLDNVAGLGKFSGFQEDLFGAVSEGNVARIKRQNKRKISVVIGNPPYNANQQNENDNNKNRDYPVIDARIKATYIKESTAQKTKAYDMYTRFFRWASDRIDKEGIVAFVTNRSFIDARTMDGFRKIAARDFSEVHIVDLGGDVRANTKLSGTKNNVFGIQTGVAISFLIRRKNANGKCRIFYNRRPEMETAEEKLSHLADAHLSALKMDEITPDAKANWLGMTANDFESLIPIASKATKAAKSTGQ
jgi:predicted helicase